jgi:rhodanese-related sulfurtransferase
MKLLLLFTALFASVLTAFAAEVPKIEPAAAAKLVAEGKAVLVDCREPAEWADTGVVEGAALLAKSDFDGAQTDWKAFLEKNAGKEIIIYCRSGGRAGTVAAALAEKGVKTANAGGFKAWAAAGQPTRKVEAKK